MKVALPIHGAAFSRQQRECVFTKFMVKGRGKASDIHSLFFTRIRTCVFPLLEAKVLLLHPQEVADDAIGEEDARLGEPQGVALYLEVAAL